MKFRPFLHHLNLRTTRLLPKITLTSKIIISFFIIVSLSFFIKAVLAAPSTTDLMDPTGSNAATNTTNTIQTSELTIDTTSYQGYIDKQTAITKGNNQESWINESLISNTVSIGQALSGTLPTDISQLTTGWVPGGMIGFTNNAIASLYQPPASGVQYIAQSVGSFLGKPAYADNGYGFSKLNGILGMWKVTRNAVYTLISLFFIIVGIMIMLRVKINPQTTVTIQSAIPKIISTLILVTFSYAIAGLLIDMSNLVLGILLTLIDQGAHSIFSDPLKKTVPQMMSLGFWETWSIAFNEFGFNTLGIIVTALSGLVGGAALGLAIGGGYGMLIGALGFGLFWLILMVFTLIQTIKLFFGLAKNYITLIIHIVIGPIEIGMGAIPGSKVNFSSWLHQVMARLAVFPGTIIFLVFGTFLVETLKDASTFLWSPSTFGWGDLASSIVGLGCLAILAKIPDLIPEMFFQIKPSPLSRAIGEGTRSIIGLPAGTFRGISAAGKDITTLRNLGRMEGGPSNDTKAGAPEEPTKQRPQGRPMGSNFKNSNDLSPVEPPLEADFISDSVFEAKAKSAAIRRSQQKLLPSPKDEK